MKLLAGCRVHLIPGLASHRLQRTHAGNRLEPEHLEKLYRKMLAAGSSASRVHQVHRTIRTALNEAKRKKIITDNPAELARAPKVEPEEVEPYNVDESAANFGDRRPETEQCAVGNCASAGLRQGEALGVKWPDSIGMGGIARVVTMTLSSARNA